jgi:hypothetical protein
MCLFSSDSRPNAAKCAIHVLLAEDVFVIAGNHVDAVGRFQVSQRPDVGASRIERAVDQISRDRDQVHAELVRSLYDGACP